MLGEPDSKHAKHKKAYGIDAKVGKHMHQPGNVDISAFFVEKIQRASGDKQSRHGEEPNQGIVATGEHSKMIPGKDDCAEYVGKKPGAVVF